MFVSRSRVHAPRPKVQNECAPRITRREGLWYPRGPCHALTTACSHLELFVAISPQRGQRRLLVPRQLGAQAAHALLEHSLRVLKRVVGGRGRYETRHALWSGGKVYGGTS